MAQSFARSWWRPAVAFVVPTLLGSITFRQGIDLLRDGLWLLGSQLLADGGALYTDLVTRDGPSDYLLLRGAFMLFGSSAWTLALLRAVLGGLVAAVGYLWARRQGAGTWAWLIPLGVIALGPVSPRWVFAVALAGSLGMALESGRSLWWWTIGGALGGALMGFGLDAAGLAILVLAAASLARRVSDWKREGRYDAGAQFTASLRLRVFIALGLVPALLFWVVAGGVFANADAWQQQVLGLGMARLDSQLDAGIGVAFFSGWRDAWGDARPFAGLTTGEQLSAAWPGQGAFRGASLRLLGLALWAIPALAIWRVQNRSRIPMISIAVAAALGSLVRGDTTYVLAALLPALWLLPVLISGLPRGRAAAGIALGVLLFLPLASESLWLAANRQRDSLAAWNRPRAQISVDEARAMQWEQLVHLLEQHDHGGPALLWPDVPGLYYFLDIPLPTAQAVLMPGWVSQSGRVVADLAASRPDIAALRLSPLYGGRGLDRTAPGGWNFLRENYEVAGNIQGAAGRFRALHRVNGGPEAVAELPLPRRLADNEQPVGNDVSPALRPEVAIGQSFWVGDSDLQGISIRWKTEGTDLTVPVRIAIWMQIGNELDTLLEFYDLDVTIGGDLHRSFFRFGPVTDTANQRVAFTIEVQADTADELRLVMHSPGPRGDDLYPDGSALLELDPLDADLYFFSY